MKRIIVTLTAATLLSLSACGGGGPSVDEISDVLSSDGDISKAQAKCIAEKVKDSDLSDESLQSLVDAPEGDLSSDDEDIINDLDLEECR